MIILQCVMMIICLYTVAFLSCDKGEIQGFLERGISLAHVDTQLLTQTETHNSFSLYYFFGG